MDCWTMFARNIDMILKKPASKLCRFLIAIHTISGNTMANSKRKKQASKDFQKVKFKVGKKKPRGLNETVATFKTRSINIKEQLKTRNDHQTSTIKKKLTLQVKNWPNSPIFCIHYLNVLRGLSLL